MEDLKLNDYVKIKPYLDMANYEGYNSNFVTMMMWNHEYHVQYEIHEHFLVMLHNYKETFFWAMPFTSFDYYKEAIDYMLSYSQEHQFEFIIDGAIESFVNIIKPIYHNQLFIEKTPYNDDYIYDRKMLETLSGKKMQKRRNHYNSFIREYPDYTYRDLDLTDDFEIILNCLNRWEYDKDRISESMTSEVRAIMYLLSSQQVLDFKVGGIFINDHMEAFIIASKLKHSTIQIHVEKANKDIRGLYPAILKEMLEHHFPSEIYVNREEDMGLENLRKSKLSLHPVKMIHKYKITRKNIQIGQPRVKDKETIKRLWLASFKDENEQTTSFYFEKIYNNETTYVLKNNNEIISILQINPMRIKKHNCYINAFFILGVCTKKTLKGQGYMKMLMNHVLNKYQNEAIYLQAYIPEIYHQFGFYASHYHQLITIDMEKIVENTLLTINDPSLLERYYNLYTNHFDEWRVRDSEYWSTLIERCKIFNDRILIYKDKGYLICHETDEELYISEFVYLNDNAALEMLGALKNNFKNITLECDMNINIEGVKNKVITMMSNQIRSDKTSHNNYINEIY